VAVSPAAALIVAEEAAVAEDLVEVEGVRAVVMAVVVVVVAMAMENLVYRRRRLPTVRRAGCAVRLHVGGCACSSWDRCGRCMSEPSASHRAGRRADDGWTRRCTTVGRCRLSSTGGVSIPRSPQLDSERGAAQP
jgi:hypothetical protein